MVSAETDFIDADAMTYLQRKTLENLNRRGVAIESMPTSNVRISYYDQYREHHLFDWLGIDNRRDLPEPIVCLCSDDPGIFATNLRNEYAHIYQTLITCHGKSHKSATSILKELVENARAYRFV